MIFVTLGSQKFQFNRLLKELDLLLENGSITEEIFAQTGYSDYEPKHFPFQHFISKDEYDSYIEKADIVLTHGGTGAIIGSVKKGKKVVAVPRLKIYGEHVDDHQTQIVGLFEESDLIVGCVECQFLDRALKEVREKEFPPYVSNTQRIIDHIDEYIKSL